MATGFDDEMSGWLRRVFTETVDGLTIRNREVTWEKPHGRGTAGRNRLGAHFWLYDRSPAYGPDSRWHLKCSPPCPDGRRFCSQHDERPYCGPDYEEAKRVAQRWANDRWPTKQSARVGVGYTPHKAEEDA